MTLEDAIKEELAELDEKIKKLESQREDLVRMLKKLLKLGTP